MTFDINSILLLIIIFQFLFMGVFLFTNRKGKRSSNILLAIFFIAMAIDMMVIFLTTQGQIAWLGLFTFVDVALLLVFGPLMYFYCKSIIYKDFTFQTRQLMHFVPFVFIGILFTFNFVNTPDEKKIKALELIYTYKLSTAQALTVIPFYLHILLYLFLSVRQVKAYKRVISESPLKLKPNALKWLNFLFRSFLVVTLISILLSVFPYTQFRELTGFLLGAFVLLIFFVINQIVFKALKQPDLFSGIPTPDKYVKSRLSVEDKNTGYQAINHLMTETKPFLDPTLSLNHLSDMLDMKSRDVSQIINERMNLSFHDFINQYRIEHAKEIMRNTPDPKVTILEILYQSGFNSKSSFNTAFKKVNAQTPTEYRNSLLSK